MGIQSTVDITRDQAIDRIIKISGLIKTKNYKGLLEESSEPDYKLKEFVDSWNPIDLTNINNWTDEMLEDCMDKPFFRFSIFENYIIDVELDDELS